MKQRKPRNWAANQSIRFTGPGSAECIHFVRDEAKITPNPDFLANAKIYVFPILYLFGPLRKQCLKSLHRDLRNYDLNGETTTHILGLFEYTYKDTGRQERVDLTLLKFWSFSMSHVRCEHSWGIRDFGIY